MENTNNIFNEFKEKSFSLPMVALRGLVVFPEMIDVGLMDIFDVDFDCTFNFPVPVDLR